MWMPLPALFTHGPKVEITQTCTNKRWYRHTLYTTGWPPEVWRTASSRVAQWVKDPVLPQLRCTPRLCDSTYGNCPWQGNPQRQEAHPWPPGARVVKRTGYPRAGERCDGGMERSQTGSWRWRHHAVNVPKILERVRFLVCKLHLDTTFKNPSGMGGKTRPCLWQCIRGRTELPGLSCAVVAAAVPTGGEVVFPGGLRLTRGVGSFTLFFPIHR